MIPGTEYDLDWMTGYECGDGTR